jgi:hypothetical protein
MKYLTAFLLLLSACAQAVTVTWEAPTARSDKKGTPLTLSEIGQYKIKYKLKNKYTEPWAEITGIPNKATSYEITTPAYFIYVSVCDTNNKCSNWAMAKK